MRKFLCEFTASATLQARILRTSPFELFVLLTVPLQTAGFLAIFRHAGRSDLDFYALIAPALIALWQLALMISGEIIARERANESLESLCATPASLATVILGRASVVTLFSMFAFVESVLTGWLLFGVDVSIGSWPVLVASLFTAGFATVCTATLMSVFFVNTRSPRTFQNALSYPFYVLGGVLVPVALFPVWVQPLSSVVFLSWSADLLRDSVHHPVVADWLARNLMVTGLGVAAFGLAIVLLRRTLKNATEEGKLALS